MHIGEDYISRKTFVLIVGGLSLLLVVLLAGLTITQYMSPENARVAHALKTDIASIIFGLGSAAVLLSVARHFAPGNPLRRIWLLLGIGVGVYALGDVVWTVLEVGSGFGEVPYPSLADVLYLSMYVFFGIGLFRTAAAFGRVVSVRMPLVAAVLLSALAILVVWAFVVAPTIADPATSLPQKVLGGAYPIGDIVFLLFPAVFILLAAPAVGGLQAARQWWVLAFGLALMSVTDITFAWLDWTGRYFSGHVVDFGWMLSLLLIAIAGSLAADTADIQQKRVGGERL
jgi:hypothetical protein